MAEGTLFGNTSMDPINYNITPADPLGSYDKGFAQSKAYEDRQRADDEFNKQKALEAQLTETLAKPYFEYKDIAPLIAQMPVEKQQAASKSWSMLSVERQQSALQQASKVWSALQSGENDTALKVLNEQKEAAENSGDAASAHGSESLIAQIENDPKQALLGMGITYGHIPGFKEIIDASSKQAENIRKEKEEPYNFRKLQADTTKSEIQSDSEQNKIDSEIDLKKAKALAAEKGKGLGLTTEQSNALYGPGGVVDTGRYNPEKLHKWNAVAIADAEISNPGMTDFLAVAGKAKLTTNAKFQQTVADLKVMPTLIDKVEEAGKKLDFSNLKGFGTVDEWAKAQTNSPELTRYMTLRNDIIMTLGKALRGTMTDKAQALEEEAFGKTLAGPALHEWAKAQKEAVQARNDEYEKFTEDKGKNKATQVRATPTGSTAYKPEASPFSKYIKSE